MKKNTIDGLKWSSISQLLRQILQYVTTIILVSLISPSDFGLMAMAVVVIGFLDIFKDLGSGAAIIQKENPSDLLKYSIYWVNVVTGISISTIIFFASPYIGMLYNSVSVQPILKVLSLSFTISGISILQKAILEKELSFQLLSKIELASSIIAFITAVFLAIEGYGVWSLVYQALVNSILSSVLIFFLSSWKPKFSFSFSELKAVTKYSLNLLGFQFVNYFARNSDYFLIGRYLGDRELGHYYLAYRIMLYPIQNITSVISRVMFPSFSIIQTDDAKFRDVYTKITNSIAFITFPMMAGLALVSFDFAEIFFSSKWNPILVAQLLVILAPVGALQSVVSSVGNIYQAKGRTDWMFKWSLFYSTLITVGFIVGLNWGIIGVAVSYLITNLITLFPVFAIPFKLIKMNILKFYYSFSKILVSVTGMVFILLVILFLIQNIMNPLFSFLILTISGILSYFTISNFINKDQISFIKHIFNQYLGFSEKVK